jgi:hypothetical protein
LKPTQLAGRTSHLALLALVLLARPVLAQQRPLVTEDPETIGAGRVLIEGGVDAAHDITYPASGLKGNLWRVPTIGLSVGVGSIAELQIDGGIHDVLSISSRNLNAPMAALVTETGDSTHDVEDTYVGIKLRLVPEAANRPSIGIRFSTKLANASVSTGLGTHTTDFYGSLLLAKTIQSVRVVANIGGATLADPLIGYSQNDELIYGLSFARAMTQATEVVGEVNGRVSVRSGDPAPGTETRGILKLGGRYTHGALRLDAAVFFGLTTIDPTIGVTAGFTYVFNAFTMP